MLRLFPFWARPELEIRGSLVLGFNPLQPLGRTNIPPAVREIQVVVRCRSFDLAPRIVDRQELRPGRGLRNPAMHARMLATTHPKPQLKAGQPIKPPHRASPVAAVNLGRARADELLTLQASEACALGLAGV